MAATNLPIRKTPAQVVRLAHQLSYALPQPLPLQTRRKAFPDAKGHRAFEQLPSLNKEPRLAVAPHPESDDDVSVGSNDSDFSADDE